MSKTEFGAFKRHLIKSYRHTQGKIIYHALNEYHRNKLVELYQSLCIQYNCTDQSLCNECNLWVTECLDLAWDDEFQQHRYMIAEQYNHTLPRNMSYIVYALCRYINENRMENDVGEYYVPSQDILQLADSKHKHEFIDFTGYIDTLNEAKRHYGLLSALVNDRRRAQAIHTVYKAFLDYLLDAKTDDKLGYIINDMFVVNEFSKMLKNVRNGQVKLDKRPFYIISNLHRLRDYHHVVDAGPLSNLIDDVVCYNNVLNSHSFNKYISKLGQRIPELMHPLYNVLDRKLMDYDEVKEHSCLNLKLDSLITDYSIYGQPVEYNRHQLFSLLDDVESISILAEDREYNVTYITKPKNPEFTSCKKYVGLSNPIRTRLDKNVIYKINYVMDIEFIHHGLVFIIRKPNVGCNEVYDCQNALNVDFDCNSSIIGKFLYSSPLSVNSESAIGLSSIKNPGMILLIKTKSGEYMSVKII